MFQRRHFSAAGIKRGKGAVVLKSRPPVRSMREGEEIPAASVLFHPANSSRGIAARLYFDADYKRNRDRYVSTHIQGAEIYPTINN